MQVKNWHPGAASPAPAQIQNIRGTPGAPPHARGRRRRRPRAARAGPVRPGSARGGRPAPRAAHPPARPRQPRAAPPAPPARARPPPRPAAAGRTRAGRTLSRKLARPRCSACCRVSRPNAPGSCGRRTRPPRAAPPAPLERAHASAAPLPARACADACAGPLSRVGQPCPAPTRPVQARKTGRPGRARSASACTASISALATSHFSSAVRRPWPSGAAAAAACDCRATCVRLRPACGPREHCLAAARGRQPGPLASVYNML